MEELVLTLKTGRNPEWAGVFAHFIHELTLLGLTGSADPSELKRLISSLQLCLSSGSGFSRLILESSESGEAGALNLRFGQFRVALSQTVREIEERLIEFVS